MVSGPCQVGEKGSILAKNHERTAMTSTRPIILFLSGFGDGAGLFETMHNTDLAQDYDLRPLSMPGFGAPRQAGETTLQTLADWVAQEAASTGAEIVVAHSVASLVAALAAMTTDSPIRTILSIEGNITAEDAYFSGTAADYPDPDTFRSAFLGRLTEMAETRPVYARFRDRVALADPVALWQLGRDARRYSAEVVPGDVLMAAANVVYLYNPDNCPKTTLDWLDHNPMPRILMEGASHWPSQDQPDLLALTIRQALG